MVYQSNRPSEDEKAQSSKKRASRIGKGNAGYGPASESARFGGSGALPPRAKTQPTPGRALGSVPKQGATGRPFYDAATNHQAPAGIRKQTPADAKKEALIRRASGKPGKASSRGGR